MPQPIIKLRANRAFLCKWTKHPALQASKELIPIGIYPDSDLLEVAGCLLRLAMWPTEKLWSYVENVLATHESLLGVQGQWKYQVGLHFRCGDNSYQHPESADQVRVRVRVRVRVSQL